ncbi:hypothetical protein EDB85DRAFT_2080724 [Lactarius pseudohatsudake]|nr:hypothetical protein EDB85DRAFT_2080724 [Lactarius pseudohatsudake]
MSKKQTFDESDEGVYHVEVITSARVNEDAEWEYLVSWAGYSSDEDSWEPAENVVQCDRLLSSFWKHIGIDDQDYSPGDRFDAQPSWIEREREFFANQWGKVKKKKRASRNKHYSFTISSSGSKKGKMEKNKSLQEFVQRQNDAQSDDSTETGDSDEIPLSKSQEPKSNEGTLPARRRKSINKQNDDSHVGSRTDSGRKEKKGSKARETSKIYSAPPTTKVILKGKRRRRLSSPDSGPDDTATATSGEPPRKLPKTRTFSISQPVTTIAKPATPIRGGGASNLDSPSSLFSAPSSPAPIHSRPAAPPPPLSLPPALPMPSPPRANVAGPSNRPRQPSSQIKATRKPNWLLQPRIKRFDAPNLKPSSSLPTKALLSGAAKSPEAPQSPTSDGRSSIQTPTSATTTRPFALDGASGLGMGIDVDEQQSHAHSPQPADPQVPLLPPASMAETEAFLNDIMPPELSEPMIDGVEPTNRPPVRKSSTADILKNTHIPRKYKWNGELCINTEKGHKERVCNVSLSDPSEGSMERLRFSICFNSSVSSLLLEKLFSLAELQCLRPALTPVAEVAKLGPEGEADTQPLNTLFIHMSSRKLVSCSTISLDDNQVALLLVFPATNLVLCKEYNVLPDLRKAGHFIAAIIPWKIVGKKSRTHRLHRDPSDRTHQFFRSGSQEVIQATERDLSLTKEPSYHRAFSILGFPKWLYNDLSDPEFKYCIWNKDGDGTQAQPGSETMALKHILKERPAKDVGLKADAYVVFVHVGALKTLSALPALMERRMKRPDVQFMTYGTHHTIPPARWGMRLIYPLGGIATISPSVFVECPSAAYKLLDMLEQHPLWDCFVTPGVVALAARQTQGSDPVTEFESGRLKHQDLLSRIGQGQLSLLRTPPHYGSGESALLAWITWQQEMSLLDPRGILEWCLRVFSQQFSDYPEEKWTVRVLDELSSVLTSLQMQPSIMDQYRRYVVITGKQDKVGYDRSGFEWTAIDAFNFRDDFISKESMDDLRSWANVEMMI